MINGKQRILKICKIDSIQFASFIIKQGADFLGIHVLEEWNMGEHYELVEFIKVNRCKAIIVTKMTDISKLQTIVEIYKPSGLQFHYEVQREVVMAIKKMFPALILFGVFTDESKFFDFDVANDLFNYLIYDTSYEGGTNKMNSYTHLNNFPKQLCEKTLLAGGITPERINQLNLLPAAGYDIQSYFRTASGLSFKNLETITDLLKFPRKNMLSVSLTDIPLNEMYLASSYYMNSNLEFHLDFSPGTLYPSFNTIGHSIEEKQQYLSQLPYSIHLFLNDQNELRKRIGKLVEKYPLNLVRIFVQYYHGIDITIFTEKIADVKIIPSILFKELDSYFSQSMNSQVISIIVPKPNHKEDIDLFINTFISYKEKFSTKEVWLDRNLDWNYIERLTKSIGNDFNYIIGKEVINDWSKINIIHEQLLDKE